eukprot:5087593-Lingulodinium_polyedra.AAC.1
MYYARASQIDGDLRVRRGGGKRAPAMARRAGDLARTGEPETAKHILTECHNVFGELKVEWRAC